MSPLRVPEVLGLAMLLLAESDKPGRSTSWSLGLLAMYCLVAIRSGIVLRTSGDFEHFFSLLQVKGLWSWVFFISFSSALCHSYYNWWVLELPQRPSNQTRDSFGWICCHASWLFRYSSHVPGCHVPQFGLELVWHQASHYYHHMISYGMPQADGMHRIQKNPDTLDTAVWDTKKNSCNQDVLSL